MTCHRSDQLAVVRDGGWSSHPWRSFILRGLAIRDDDEWRFGFTPGSNQLGDRGVVHASWATARSRVGGLGAPRPQSQ